MDNIAETELKSVAGKVKDVFEQNLGMFRHEDFIAVARILGFTAYRQRDTPESVKLVGESNMPDLFGANLSYALQAYTWTTHKPMTEDGLTISGFWDTRKSPMPQGYELVMEGRVLRKRDAFFEPGISTQQ